MAFTAELNDNGQAQLEGTKKRVTGTYTNTSGSTGGEVATGLRKIDYMNFQPIGAAVAVANVSINESLPLEVGTVTIVTTADEDGMFEAYGE